MRIDKNYFFGYYKCILLILVEILDDNRKKTRKYVTWKTFVHNVASKDMCRNVVWVDNQGLYLIRTENEEKSKTTILNSYTFVLHRNNMHGIFL